MSISYMNRVWSDTALKQGALLVMLALADHANDAGECWPSQPHLAQKARLTDRQIRRVIAELDAAGYIEVVEVGNGRGTKSHYKLYPNGEIKADKMSEERRTKCHEPKQKADILTQKGGHFGGEKVDISAQKADILNTNQSHARSEPPIEPPITEPPIESSSLNEDDLTQADALEAAWEETYDTAIPENLSQPLNRLLRTFGAEAVAYGIRASANASKRSIGYIATCARNYVPPAPQAPPPSYAVDIPGVHRLKPSPALSSPMPHADPWIVALAELSPSFPGVAATYLEGSALVAAGDVDGVPLYRVVVGEGAAVGLSWLTAQAGPAIRRKLSSILGKPALIEIVAPTHPSDPESEEV